MRRVRAGLIGAGFVGPLHVEAARRLGFVDFVALASSNAATARQKAKALHIPQAYSHYEELLADDSIEVVHICTPNDLHYPIVKDAILKRKHVICDKPLALTAVQARELVELAREAHIVNAVTFNYRFHPLIQQARAMIQKGELGELRFVHGGYWQDWLMYDTDFSWRLEPAKGGVSCAMGDIGSHWCDTAQFITGRRIKRVLAALSTIVPLRKKPVARREAFQAAADDERFDEYLVTSDDLGTVIFDFEGGVRGTFSVGQICPGHKNDLQIEVNGARASLRWQQERPDEMWIGRRDAANSLLLRDASLLDSAAQRYANLPGGHSEGWADAFKNLLMSIYTFIAAGGDPVGAPDNLDFPTFEDGYRANCIVDAIVRSNQDRSLWTAVEYE